jgi:hypothetical protein
LLLEFTLKEIKIFLVFLKKYRTYCTQQESIYRKIPPLPLGRKYKPMSFGGIDRKGKEKKRGKFKRKEEGEIRSKKVK